MPGNDPNDPVAGYPQDPSTAGLPAFWLVGWGLFCILVGHGLGYWRAFDPTAAAKYSRSNRFFVSFLLFLMLAGFGGIFFYETVGLLRVSANPLQETFEPATYYVRCAIHYDMYPPGSSVWHFPLLTMLVVTGLCGILGHWLWPPHRSYRLELEIKATRTK